MNAIPGGGVLLTTVAIVVIALLLMGMASRLYRKEPPNKALIIYGGATGRRRGQPAEGEALTASRILVGGGAIVWPWVQSAKVLGLEQFGVPIQDQNVPSKDNILIDVVGNALVKVGATTASILTAAQNFLDRTDMMQPNIQRVLQGHMRAIVATMTVDDLVHNHEAFQAQIANKSKPELEAMGLELVALTISSVTDKVNFIVNKGKPAIAEVEKLAAIAQAQNQRQSAEEMAKQTQAAQTAQLAAQVAVAESTKDRDLRVAEFAQQTAAAQAVAEMAGPLKKAEIQKDLATREGGAAIERERQNALAQEQAAVVAENRTRAEVIIPAQAGRDAAIATAEGDKARAIAQAEGSSKATQLDGEAQAAAERAKGLATADVTKANKLAEAEGEQQLSAARSANDNVNLVQFAIEKHYEYKSRAAEFQADAIGRFGSKVSMVQIGGNGHDGSGVLGTPEQLASFMSRLNAESEALTGMGLREMAGEVAGLIHSFRDARTTPQKGGTANDNEAELS